MLRLSALAAPTIPGLCSATGGGSGSGAIDPSTGMGTDKIYAPGSLALEDISALTTQQIPGMPLFSIELRLKAAEDTAEFTPTEQDLLQQGQKALQDACQDIIPDDLDAQMETLQHAQLLVQSAQIFGDEVYGQQYQQLTKSLNIYSMRMRLALALLDSDRSPEIESVFQLGHAPLSYAEINTLLPMIGRMMSSDRVRNFTELRHQVNGLLEQLEGQLSAIRTRNVQDGHFPKLDDSKVRWRQVDDRLFSAMQKTNSDRDQIIQNWKAVTDPEAAPILATLYEFFNETMGLTPEETKTFLYPAEGEQAPTMGNVMDSLNFAELSLLLEETFDIDLEQDEETGWSEWTVAELIAHLKPLIEQDASTE